MTCFHPLRGYRALKSGCDKAEVVFSKSVVSAGPHERLEIPCGQCIGCRVDRSRDWALRCVHEAQMHDENCFVTLTFDEPFLDVNGSLNRGDWIVFIRELRRDNAGKRIRYFHCGEYGEDGGRPHHHACLFGYDFPDKELFFIRDGVRHFKSGYLEQLWGKGFCLIGEVTFESAAYIARYIIKKDMRQIENYLVDLDEETGECTWREPEYISMSNRPGIGKEWFDKFKSDCRKDYLTWEGKKFRVPKYYDKLLAEDDQLRMKKVKYKRRRKGGEHVEDNTLERLAVREYIKQRSIALLERSYERC